MLCHYVEDYVRFGAVYQRTEIEKKRWFYTVEYGILSYLGKQCVIGVKRYLSGGCEILGYRPVDGKENGKAEMDELMDMLDKRVSAEIDSQQFRSPIARRASALLWTRVLQIILIVFATKFFVWDWYMHHNFIAVIVSIIMMFIVIAVEFSRVFLHGIQKFK